LRAEGIETSHNEEDRMKKLMMVAGTLAAVAAWSAAPVQGQGASTPAQDTKAAQGMKAPDAKGKTMQLTGCLGKGADANSFVLSDAMASTGAAMAGKDKADASMHADMKSYRVTAKEDLKLTGHVGHKIEVTGQVDSSAAGSSGMGSGAAGSMGSAKTGDTGAAKPGTGASASMGKSGAMPHLMVTSMKHISPTCP